jgi:hypothetical protein
MVQSNLQMDGDDQGLSGAAMSDPTHRETPSPEHEVNDPSPSESDGMRDPEAPIPDDPLFQPDTTEP